MKHIPYGRQDITAEDIGAVEAVLRSDYLTQGPAIPAFEAAVAQACQVPHAVAVHSATAALHLAYLALGLGPGDTVWTSPNTFVATANAALYCGADVDFVDIDPETLNLSVPALAQRLEQAAVAGRLPKIVTPVHFAGQSCAMQDIRALAQRYGFAVVEDASHAIGGRYLDEPIGNCRYSDITVFSFHPVKIVTTAEGGLATTRDARLELLRSHGITRDAARMENPVDGPWYYEQIELGFNYRMTDLQAALGRSQMTRLQAYVERRHVLARRYDEALHGLPLERVTRRADNHSALHLYPIRLHDASRRRAVFEGLRADGIGVNVHYIPVHLQPVYRRRGFARGQFPVAEAYYDGAISLPLFPRLGDDDQHFVIERLRHHLR